MLKRLIEYISKPKIDIEEEKILREEIKKMDQLVYEGLFRDISNFHDSPEIPLFKNIEIETINHCNGECSFCPVNKNDDPRDLTIMKEELFNNIISQLKDLDYSGYIGLFSNNEPFLDKRIFDFAKIARKKLPNAYIGVYTNGSLLTVDKFLNIIDNLDFMIIDNYSDKLEMTKETKIIHDFCVENPEYKKKVTINLFLKNKVRQSRGGLAKNRVVIDDVKSSCALPFSQMIVRPDGKISLCCNDALGKVTLGDLTKDKIIDVWTNQEYKNLRKKLYKKEYARKNLPMCSKCDSIYNITKHSPPTRFLFKDAKI